VNKSQTPATVAGRHEVPAPLDAAQLIHSCDCEALGFKDTSELQPLAEPLGQERVLEAIGFGTAMTRGGYNLYVMGSAGVGKHHLLTRALAARAAEETPPADWCYVADFANPDRPNALSLPAGRGSELRRDMKQLVEDLLSAIPAAFQSDEYRRRAQEIQDEFKKREDDTAAALGEKAAEKNIALLSTPTGYSLAPMKDDKVLSPNEFDSLTDAEKEAFQASLEELKEQLRAALGRIPLWQREIRQRFRELDADVTALTVTSLTQELERHYDDLPKVLEYLHSVRDDVVENVQLFRAGENGDTPSADDSHFTRYRVNLLVDNGDTQGAPVIYEDHPNYQNLLGRIEHIAHMGTLMTDFTLIKPGALHRACGGYLVLDVEKVLTKPFAWDALKRALNGEEIRIEPVERMVGLAGTVSLEPEPIPLQIKVALVGDRQLYYLLKEYDPEFSALFKVVADFSEDTDRNDDQEQHYARLIATLQQRERLRPISADGVGRLIDWSSRRARDGLKLSLHLGSLTDLLREADHYAGLKQEAQTRGEHVQQAIEAQIYRVDQFRSRLHEAIERGILLIDVEGRQLGQVNGLVVIPTNEHAFGSATRISATARIGSGEVVDIEHEAKLGGAIHSKGVMILSAYLANRYARHQPLSVSASLVFEQSYGEVEGDSASVGELCALLSAIGDLSIKQSLAVTGSVNQHGQVQAIGGVNEKIEGFFDICRDRGLTGEQGVIIPQANVADLMLRQDVREAVAAGQFTIYAVTHTDQVLALLTGMPAGRPDAEGLYPENTCNGLVQRRLFEWTALRQQYSSAGNN
jgi:lon-related putative ATP-dependent protease